MCDSSTVGSTPPCQGGGRGFESRLSLFRSQRFLRAFYFYNLLLILPSPLFPSIFPSIFPFTIPVSFCHPFHTLFIFYYLLFSLVFRFCYYSLFSVNIFIFYTIPFHNFFYLYKCSSAGMCMNIIVHAKKILPRSRHFHLNQGRIPTVLISADRLCDNSGKTAHKTLSVTCRRSLCTCLSLLLTLPGSRSRSPSSRECSRSRI